MKDRASSEGTAKAASAADIEARVTQPSRRHRHPEPKKGGILLYYKYVYLGEAGRAAVRDWYETSCRAEGLRGRVRIALDGVNCTLGGELEALQRHIEGVKTHAVVRGEDIDFKLSASAGPRNPLAAMESGFTGLAVKEVKEVVSIGSRGAGLSHIDGGRHVSPHEFHRLLKIEEARSRGPYENAEDSSLPTDNSDCLPSSDVFDEPLPTSDGSDCHTVSTRVIDTEDSHSKDENFSLEAHKGLVENQRAVLHCGEEQGQTPGERSMPAGTGAMGQLYKESVLLDVRNVYETSIGHFSVDGVETLDPKTRQFSDLPKWVDDNVDRLRGKQVLMYCTGGVRCEMASALVRQQCHADSTNTEVLQLSGGIERYLQAYPPGAAASEAFSQSEGSDVVSGEGGVRGKGEEEGFFRGKNFVFDERVSVPETPAGGVLVGACLLCQAPWDDYGSRSRCARCRVLLLVCDACLEARDEALSASAQDAPGRSRAGNCQAVDFRSSRHLGATQNSRHTTAEEAGKTAKRHMAEARDAAESAGKAAANLAKPPIATAQGHRSFPTAQREGYDRKSNASTTICDDGVHCGAGGREATATYTELVHACAPDDFESRKRVARVGKELLCPTCDGRSVSTGS